MTIINRCIKDSLRELDWLWLQYGNAPLLLLVTVAISLNQVWVLWLDEYTNISAIAWVDRQLLVFLLLLFLLLGCFSCLGGLGGSLYFAGVMGMPPKTKWEALLNNSLSFSELTQ